MAAESDVLDDFFLEQQGQTNWCWAAIGVAVARFMRGQQRTQCDLAQATLRPPGVDCCATPGDPACNEVAMMSAVLREAGVRRRTSPSQPQGTISFAVIKGDIARDRPIICLMIGPTDHYVVIVGWFMRDGTPCLRVDDPREGLRKEVSFSDFFTFEGRAWDQTTRLA